MKGKLYILPLITKLYVKALHVCTFDSPRFLRVLPSCPSPFDLRPFLPEDSFTSRPDSWKDNKDRMGLGED